MPDTPPVTLVRNAIHNPTEPRHFMRVVPAGTTRSASVGETSLASSAHAMVVKEVGLDMYDHVIYFPRADVNMDALVPIDQTTHCPLKGDTEYFDVLIDGERLPAAAWSYVSTIEVAEILRDLIAFDTSKVSVG